MIATGDTFTLMAAILAVAAGVGFVANRARQPLIVAFIAVGILVGPSALDWVRDGLLADGMMREVEMSSAMPKVRPWLSTQPRAINS